VSEDVAIAQIVTAITTVFYAAVFAIGYYLIVRGNRKTLMEMREERLSGGRPQVIVEMGLLNLPNVEFVVRNVSGGAARDITFEFSGSIEDSSGFVISELRYLKEGIPFLGPGEKIGCLWDHFDRLILYLEEKGPHEGIAVKVSYKDLPGEAYATEWRINPLLYKGLRYDANQLPQEIPADARRDKTGGPTKEWSFSSCMGNASMSALRATVLPGLPPSTTPSTPVMA
jgi:hypothetical protein